MAIVTITTIVVAGGTRLWFARHYSPQLPTSEDIVFARAELDGEIDWLTHEGVPTSSLGDRCGAHSPDSIQVFEGGGMALSNPVCLAISLQGNHLKTACVQFTPKGKRYISSETMIPAEKVRNIWATADQITTRMTSASAYPYEGTDMPDIALESCRNGHYVWVERYMGTKDPDNSALSDFNTSLWRLSGVNRAN